MASKTERGARTARISTSDVLLIIAVVSSLVFIWLIAVPAFGPARAARHADHLPMLWAHIIGGIVMLLTGAAALRIGITRHWFGWHKRAGYTYLAAGSVAAISALIRSFDAEHTPGLSTGTLAVVWLVFSAMAFRAIRNRQFLQHREWMIRSYVAAWTFVFCRLVERTPPEFQFEDKNGLIWLTWILPVLACEVALQWSRGARAAKSDA